MFAYSFSLTKPLFCVLFQCKMPFSWHITSVLTCVWCVGQTVVMCVVCVYVVLTCVWCVGQTVVVCVVCVSVVLTCVWCVGQTVVVAAVVSVVMMPTRAGVGAVWRTCDHGASLLVPLLPGLLLKFPHPDVPGFISCLATGS